MGCDFLEAGEAVSTVGQGSLRFMTKGGQMLVVAADVGGIAHDEIVACAFGDGLPPGAFAEFDFGAQRLGVAAGNGESLFGDVRGGHARPGALLGERHGNAAAARAHVEDLGLFGGDDQGLLNEDLRVGTRNENVVVDREVTAEELLTAGKVGDGHAVKAHGNVDVERHERGVGKLFVIVGDQIFLGLAQNVGEKDHRLEAPDLGGRFADQGADGVELDFVHDAIRTLLGQRGELLRLVLCGQSRDDLLEITVHDSLKAIEREVDAVVGHAALRVIVRADSFGAVPRADQALALARLLGLLLGHLGGMEAGGKVIRTAESVF